jgi:hypothetical protein
MAIIRDLDARRKAGAWAQERAMAETELTGPSRGPPRPRKRMVWAERVAALSDAEFRRTYRMSESTFNIVLAKIRPRLVGKRGEAVARARAQARTGSDEGWIVPELRLSMALRLLAGASTPPYS